MTEEQAMAARSPYDAQVTTLLDRIDGLSRQYQNPVLQARDVAYTAPDVAQYTPQRFSDVSGGGANTNREISPYWTLLGEQQRRRQLTA
jgi:hypothetical protein